MSGSFGARMAKITGVLATMALLLAVPLQARAENLTDAMIGAYNTSGLLEQNRALLRAADEDVAEAISTLRPVIEWSASASRSLSRSLSDVTPDVVKRNMSNAFVGLTADLLLFDSGGRRHAINAAKETVLATRQTLISIEQDVLLRAVAAYFNVVLQQQIVSLRENNLNLLDEELSATQDRFEVGEVTRTDVALAESRQAAARSNLVAARGDLDNARAEYLAAVGHEPQNLVQRLDLPGAPASADAATAVAVRSHPDILAAQRQVTAAEYNVRRAESAIGPKIALRGDVGMRENLTGSGYERDATVSLNLSQPIYQGGGLNAQVRRAMATRDSIRASLLTAQENVALNATNAYVRFDVARSSLSATGERIRAAQVAFDGIREEARLGARTTLDVLQAEQELLDARTEQLSARAEESIAAYQLLAAQGLLTVDNLNLAVQVYDPTLYYNMVKDAPSRISKQGRDLDRVLKALGKE